MKSGRNQAEVVWQFWLRAQVQFCQDGIYTGVKGELHI